MNMDLLADKVSQLAGFVWNGLLLYLLVGTGIILSLIHIFPGSGGGAAGSGGHSAVLWRGEGGPGTDGGGPLHRPPAAV